MDIEALEKSICDQKIEAAQKSSINMKRELLFFAIDKNLVILQDLSMNNDRNWISYGSEYERRKTEIINLVFMEQTSNEMKMSETKGKIENQPNFQFKLQKQELLSEIQNINHQINQLMQISNLLDEYLRNFFERFEELKSEIDQTSAIFHRYKKNWKDTVKLFEAVNKLLPNCERES
ncbi:unnamed protein product [Caenorhabditis angaria]|uniref:Uncharacterized protein n=1 Tax=Caenorhabditis angaria TaxID=860376 RepID=A0A9P1IJI4_9PELO|nr:unnamed protein product [Caenorhabditis angaria]